MQAAAASTEITLLGWSIILLIVQILLQSGTAIIELGLPYAMSPHDEGKRVQGVIAGRVERALRNLLETYAAFVALALALAVTGKTGGWGATGALVWFWARVVYLPLYVFGIPGLRTLVWAVSVIGLVMMLVRLFS